MNQSYIGRIDSDASPDDIESFKTYLLSQDTIIVQDSWDLVCSPWVEKKIKDDPELVSDSYFYTSEDKVYFIYSRYFEGVWDVKVLFDTTSYVNTQLVIIKVGLIFICVVFFLQFLAGRYISSWLLRDLKNISQKLKTVDINSREKHITCECMPVDDEIRILAEALNISYDTIDSQTSKLKQFLTDVSHEFKTPLMAMSSKLDLSEKKREKNSFTQKDLESLSSDLRNNISKLNGLLETLFFLSRIEESSWCLVRSDITVRDYIEQKIKDMEKSFPSKNINYDLVIDTNLIYSVEESTFSILLDNLLSNAIKFSPKNAQISITAQKESFSISDNGPWLSAEWKKKIWEKFYRSDTNIEGFWVGLYLVKRIVNMYNWDISVRNNKNIGATFKVDLREAH